MDMCAYEGMYECMCIGKCYRIFRGNARLVVDGIL